MKNKDEAVVIGTGPVGIQTVQSLKIRTKVSSQLSQEEIKEISEKKFIFLCLPTPTDENGVQDIQIIRNYVRDIASYSTKPIIIIRSTVLPGTAHNLSSWYEIRVASVPEFLTEDTADEDTKNPDFILIGSDDKEVDNEITALYKKYYKKTLFINTTSVTAELIKYSTNAFFAMKVVFANEIYDIAQRLGAHYPMIKVTMYKNKFIGNNHLEPFHKNYRGAGGRCLAKDLEAFNTFSGSELLKVVTEINRGLLRNIPL